MALEDGFSRVSFVPQDNMMADETGLVHGGFIFGLADYAAMISVNHPNVVLGSAEVKFLKPVKVNEALVAESVVQSSEGKKRIVTVTVKKEETTVFEGVFTCFVLEKHVLAK
jgi:acyl-coenzyme A thioesterase PaaI-like protein